MKHPEVYAFRVLSLDPEISPVARKDVAKSTRAPYAEVDDYGGSFSRTREIRRVLS